MHNGKEVTEKLVSIIMPVYNTQTFVAAAVESVLAQTYPRWELLIVDDGSTDGSGAICDTLAERDARIRVFHVENGGVSRARNRGLLEARGDAVCFLDSDDRYEANYLSTMMAWQQEVEEMPLCCGFVAETEEEQSTPARPMDRHCVGRDDFLYEALTGRLALPLCCWTWMFPLDRTITFDEDLAYGEDTLFVCRQLLQHQSVYYNPLPLYRYRMDRQGNTVTEISLKKAENQYRSARCMADMLAGGGSKAAQAATKYLVECAASCARVADREKDSSKYREYKKLAMAHWKQLKKADAISAKEKVRLLLYALSPRESEKIMLRRYGRV